jgi:hypothetical protein
VTSPGVILKVAEHGRDRRRWNAMAANLHPLDESKPGAVVDPTAAAVDPKVPPVDPTVDRAGEALRELALDRLKKKADFRMHVLTFVLFNGMFVLIWAMTGRHFFWPVIPLCIWGIGIIAHAMETFGRPVPTEDDIRQEMDRLRS